MSLSIYYHAFWKVWDFRMGFSCGSTGSEERTEEIIYMISSHWSSTNNMHWQCCVKRQDNWTVFSSWLVFCSKFCYLQKFFPLIKSICTSRVAQMVKRLSTMWETRVWSLGREDSPGKWKFQSFSSTFMNLRDQITQLWWTGQLQSSMSEWPPYFRWKSSHGKKIMFYCFKYQAAIGGRQKPCILKSKSKNLEV